MKHRLVTLYSSLSTGAIAGIAVAGVIAILAAAAAFFYRRKLKSVEQAYNQLCDVHTSQQQTNVPVAFSTSLGSTPASFVRNVVPTSSSGHSRQPSNTATTFPISSASETDSRGLTVPFDQSQVMDDFSMLPYFTDIFRTTAIFTEAPSKGTTSGAFADH